MQRGQTEKQQCITGTLARFLRCAHAVETVKMQSELVPEVSKSVSSAGYMNPQVTTEAPCGHLSAKQPTRGVPRNMDGAL